MLNPQPHINTHEPWIWREFERQLPLENVRTGIGAGAASPAASLRLPSWSPGEVVATNEAYGAALRTIGASDPRIIAIEGEADSSTYHQVLPDPRGGRSVQTVIAEQESASAEQRMVAAAISLQTRGLIPFAAAFADSWTSAHDLIRMAAIKSADIRLIGSHAGVAGDEDASSKWPSRTSPPSAQSTTAPC